jgi:hypothetical protein
VAGGSSASSRSSHPSASPSSPDWREDDDELLALLRPYANAVDGPPPEYVRLAEGAFPVHQFDAELAEVLADSDSALGRGREGTTTGRTAPEPAQVRDGGGRRSLTLRVGAGAELLLDLRDGVLVGWTEEAVLRRAEWRTPEGTGAVEVSDGRAFTLLSCPRGPFCLVVDVEGSPTPVATPWLLAS